MGGQKGPHSVVAEVSRASPEGLGDHVVLGIKPGPEYAKLSWPVEPNQSEVLTFQSHYPIVTSLFNLEKYQRSSLKKVPKERGNDSEKLLSAMDVVHPAARGRP